MLCKLEKTVSKTRRETPHAHTTPLLATSFRQPRPAHDVSNSSNAAPTFQASSTVHVRSHVSFWGETATIEASFVGHAAVEKTVKRRIFGGHLPSCAARHVDDAAHLPPPTPSNMST